MRGGFLVDLETRQGLKPKELPSVHLKYEFAFHISIVNLQICQNSFTPRASCCISRNPKKGPGISQLLINSFELMVSYEWT